MLIPDLTTGGRLVGTSSLPFTRCSARSVSLTLRSCFVSGRYLSIRRNTWLAADTQHWLLYDHKSLPWPCDFCCVQIGSLKLALTTYGLVKIADKYYVHYSLFYNFDNITCKFCNSFHSHHDVLIKSLAMWLHQSPQQACMLRYILYSCCLTCLPVKCLSELVDWWRNLQALHQNCLLALQTDVLWPSHKATQVTLWLDVLACVQRHTTQEH